MSYLEIRRLEREDLPVRVKWFNTPSVYNQMTIEGPLSLAGTQKWFTNTVLNEHRRDFTLLMHITESPTILAAMGGLVDINRYNRRAELYIVVNPEFTGRGIGQKAIQWLCNFGFLQLNLLRIYLYSLSENEGARRLYERNGFIHEGILRNHVLHNSEFVDRHVHALLRSDWENQAWRMAGHLSSETDL